MLLFKSDRGGSGNDRMVVGFTTTHAISRGGFRGGVRPLPPKIRKTYYTTLIMQFNKQLFHEWLTRDL